MAELYGGSNREEVIDCVNIIIDNDSVIHEWSEAFVGEPPIKRPNRKRIIEKVPSLLLQRSEHKNIDYDPLVISLGPYHHQKRTLHLGEKFKQTALQIYVEDSGKKIDEFKQKVLEVVGIARSCYVQGSTDAYKDDEFAQMMLLDGCCILDVIEWISYSNDKMILIFEHLGGSGGVHLLHDMFLLENQLPYAVLQVLMSLKFSDDEGEKMLDVFFNKIIFGERFRSEQKVTGMGEDGKQQPLHLLELYRKYFLSKSGTLEQPLTQWKNKKNKFDHIHSFRSVIDLKAKGIQFKASSSKSITDIKFKSHCLYGQLELPVEVVNQDAMSLYLNMIAYEMCLHNPNDFRVVSYLGFMKSLITCADDVKELRSEQILLNNFGSDEEVAKMFEEMDIPLTNLDILKEVKESIQEHCNSKANTWIAEFFSQYFSSPWTVIALLAATFLFTLNFLQTYFTVSPPKN